MNAPFGLFDKRNANSTRRELAVDFKDQANREDLQQLHASVLRLERKLHDAVRAEARKHGQRVDKIGSVLRESKKRTRLNKKYPPYMVLKFWPEYTVFEDTDGQVLDVESIDFKKVSVQPTVYLSDLWEFNGGFYPRLLINECTVHSRVVNRLD